MPNANFNYEDCLDIDDRDTRSAIIRYIHEEVNPLIDICPKLKFELVSEYTPAPSILPFKDSAHVCVRAELTMRGTNKRYYSSFKGVQSKTLWFYFDKEALPSNNALATFNTTNVVVVIDNEPLTGRHFTHEDAVIFLLNLAMGRLTEYRIREIGD